jgi:predicted RNA-binding protein YlxR (DUF448 family)
MFRVVTPKSAFVCSPGSRRRNGSHVWLCKEELQVAKKAAKKAPKKAAKKKGKK